MTTDSRSPARHDGRKRSRAVPVEARSYPAWFFIPAAIVFGVLFLAPMLSSFWFALTRWTLFESTFIGLDNFEQFLREPFLIKGLVNTLIYAVLTSGLKVVFGMALAVVLTSPIAFRDFLRSVIFFPVLVSTVGVGLTFTVLMHPDHGLINQALASVGIEGPSWLTDPRYALLSVALVDVWKGVGLATLIYIAGIVAIPAEYHEAARIEGANWRQQFTRVTLPLARPATVTVVILSFIGGLRSFDLIWAMTRGGPGFTTDVIASVIYKQYQAGFYGLSTAGNVVLFVLITALVVPLYLRLNKDEAAS